MDTPDERSRLLGTVVAVQANFYRVRFHQDCPGHELLCTQRGLLKKLGQTVMVGDRVQVEEPDWAGGRGAISQILPRRTELVRPPIANADQILLVFSLAQPPLNPFQVTKFLLTAEQSQLRLILGLSKADLVSETVQRNWCDRLASWGYEAVPFSLISEQGLTALDTKLKQKITVLSGPSGVGKSSFINHFNSTLQVRVGAVSERWQQGRHTTRHVELFNLGQGLVADSPGFSQPDLEISPAHLASLFPEIRELLGHCQFKDCLHRDEPNCVVPSTWDRRKYYVQILEELIHRQELDLQKSKAEQQQKSKSSRAGAVSYEPRLEAKKYRRQSRRQQHQRLEDYYDEELSQL